jgi:hypothetical protein
MEMLTLRQDNGNVMFSAYMNEASAAAAIVGFYQNWYRVTPSKPNLLRALKLKAIINLIAFFYLSILVL